MTNLDSWKEKLYVCWNYTSNCVNLYEDDYFDILTHDMISRECTKTLPIMPKLKVGGLWLGMTILRRMMAKHNQTKAGHPTMMTQRIIRGQW